MEKTRNILVTGAGGFVGKNLVSELENIRTGKEMNSPLDRDFRLLCAEKDTTPEELKEYCASADFVFHLAGVNRPERQEDYMAGNADLTEKLLSYLKEAGNACPVMLSSSTQAELDNPYGESKRRAEELVREYGRETGAKVYIYRFTNIFGKWCRPGYNSVVATFCHNIANDLPINVRDPEAPLKLIYIDDVVKELTGAPAGRERRKGEFCFVEPVFETTLGRLSGLIRSFDEGRKALLVPDVGDAFTGRLYATYLSYLPERKAVCGAESHTDERGSFTELLKFAGAGQLSVNVIKPGEVKGEHWHHTKSEKFVVIKGRGLVEMRRIGAGKDGEPYPVSSFELSGDSLKVLDILPGYAHRIRNLSDSEELITLMWASEIFDPMRADTYREKV